MLEMSREEEVREALSWIATHECRTMRIRLNPEACVKAKARARDRGESDAINVCLRCKDGPVPIGEGSVDNGIGYSEGSGVGMGGNVTGSGDGGSPSGRLLDVPSIHRGSAARHTDPDLPELEPVGSGDREYGAVGRGRGRRNRAKKVTPTTCRLCGRLQDPNTDLGKKCAVTATTTWFYSYDPYVCAPCKIRRMAQYDRDKKFREIGSRIRNANSVGKLTLKIYVDFTDDKALYEQLAKSAWDGDRSISEEIVSVLRRFA